MPKNNNVPHSGVFFYRGVGEGERDSSFLLNKGKNSWPLVEKTKDEINEELRKFHNRFL